MNDGVNIKNRKAFYNYEVGEKFTAGIQLLGTEIKSIRNGHATLRDAYCYFNDNNELYVKKLKVELLKDAATNNHDPERVKKLLLNKKEIQNIIKEIEKGFVVIVLRLFTNGKGFAKLEIALAKGKKKYDKREAIKKREVDRELKRERIK